VTFGDRTLISPERFFRFPRFFSNFLLFPQLSLVFHKLNKRKKSRQPLEKNCFCSRIFLYISLPCSKYGSSGKNKKPKEDFAEEEDAKQDTQGMENEDVTEAGSACAEEKSDFIDLTRISEARLQI
jgi:hypothetical protein